MTPKKILSFVVLIVTTSIVSARSIDETREILGNFYQDLPVLVTGGAGFVGSYLTEELVKLGARVTILDNFSTGSLFNLRDVKKQIKIIKGSITDFSCCLKATTGIKIIFHLAAHISVPQSMKNPLLCHTTNDIGTFFLLEAARRNQVERFIFSSSCAVYGNKESICLEEDVVNPTSPYGFSKVSGERFCSEFSDLFDVQCVMLRYFNIYGARQNPDGPYAAVIAKFIHNMARNKPIVVYGDGTQTRDFVPVYEVVYANLLAGYYAPVITGEKINIASGNQLSLVKLISLLHTIFPDYCGDVLFTAERQGDIKRIGANIEKYRMLKNWIIEENNIFKENV